MLKKTTSLFSLKSFAIVGVFFESKKVPIAGISIDLAVMLSLFSSEYKDIAIF